MINEANLIQLKSQKDPMKPQKAPKLKQQGPSYSKQSKNSYGNNSRRLIVVVLISLVFIAGQITAGIISTSIAIVSNAIHLVTDLVGFIFSFLFVYLSKRKPNSKMTFGYHRMQLLGALSNLFIIYVLTLFIIVQSTQRIMNHSYVQKPFVMLVTSCGGLIANIIMYKIRHGANSHVHGFLNEDCGHVNSQSQQSTKAREKNNHQNVQTNHQLKCQQSLCSDDQCNQIVQQAHCHKNQNIHKHQANNGKIDKGKPQRNRQIKQQNHQPNQKHRQNHQNHLENKKQQGILSSIIHALADMIISISLIFSALVIFLLGNPNDYLEDVNQWNPWHLFDPISTCIFSVITLASTIPVIRNAYFLMMESTPSYININQLQQQFESVAGVSDVHDLHVWDLKPGKTVLIAHVLASKGTERYCQIEENILVDVASRRITLEEPGRLHFMPS